MTLQESSLLRSLSSVTRYNARDIADLCQLYMIALHILRCDFDNAPFARDYARETISYNNWDNLRINNTDLYQLLNILIAQSQGWTHNLKNPRASETLLDDIQLDPMDVRRFLHNISGTRFDADLSGRLLLHTEHDLKIQTSNYRSMRRIAADWNHAHVTQEAKSLVVTRLLQAMRHKALQGDLTPVLKHMAQKQDLELKNVCDPETGAGCDASATPAASAAKGPSLLKQLAVGAGLGVGAYLLGKAMFGGNK